MSTDFTRDSQYFREQLRKESHRENSAKANLVAQICTRCLRHLATRQRNTGGKHHQHLNNIHPNIQFTEETEENISLPLPDVSVSKNRTGRFVQSHNVKEFQQILICDIPPPHNPAQRITKDSHAQITPTDK